MADLLGRADSILGAAFSSDAGTLILPAIGSAVGLIVQNLSLSYRQPVRQIFEVGSPQRYYVAGRPEGQAGLQRVVGPGGILSCLYSTYGDVCNAPGNSLFFGIGSAGCISGDGAPAASAVSSQGFTAYNVVIVDIGINVQAQDMLINEQMQMMFGMLKGPPCDPETGLTTGTATLPGTGDNSIVNDA